MSNSGSRLTGLQSSRGGEKQRNTFRNLQWRSNTDEKPFILYNTNLTIHRSIALD